MRGRKLSRILSKLVVLMSLDVNRVEGWMALFSAPTKQRGAFESTVATPGALRAVRRWVVVEGAGGFDKVMIIGGKESHR